jgi:hypothetical protein
MANQFLSRVVVYGLVILLVMYWSGSRTTRTVYDAYRAELEGVAFSVKDRAASVLFYQRVLEFQPIKSHNEIVGIQMPSSRRLYFRAESGSPSVGVIRVRNGFKKLHARLVTNSGEPSFNVPEGNYEQVLPPSRVSAIVRRSEGMEFWVADPDGNKLVFYEPRRRSLSWMPQ